jgi:hypothetical protein
MKEVIASRSIHWLTGTKRSLAAVEKTRQALLGKPRPPGVMEKCRRNSFTPEANEKRRIAMRGRPVTAEKKEQLRKFATGRCPSAASNALRSASCRKTWTEKLGTEQRSYDRHPRYSPQATAWRKAVFKRDAYACQACGVSGAKKYLEAHHIKSWANFPTLRYEVANGITLCRIPCHRDANQKQRVQERLT